MAEVAEPWAGGRGVDHAGADRGDQGAGNRVTVAALGRHRAHRGDLGHLRGHVQPARPARLRCRLRMDCAAPGFDGVLDLVEGGAVEQRTQPLR